MVGWLGVLWWLAFGAGEGLLWYRICVPCKKRLPGVRDASSETFGAQNRLLWYRMRFRYHKPPPTVRNEATGCGHCVASSDPKMRPLSSGLWFEDETIVGVVPVAATTLLR